MTDISTITANGTTYNIKDPVARAGLNAILTLAVGSFSAFPKTVSNAAITSDMVALECNFSNPSAIKSDVGWSTTNGSITLTGIINGSTTANIVLGKSQF